MSSKSFTLESLRYIRAIQEQGSFSAAARAHGVAQPTLSNSVAKLERQLGGELFHRSPRGVSATEFGKKILPLIENALVSLDDVSIAAARFSNPSHNCLRIGTSSIINASLFPRIRDLASSSTSAREIVFTEAPLQELRAGLLSGELDLILIPAVAPMQGFEHRIFDSEPMAVVGLLDGPGSPIDIAELHNSRLIFAPKNSGLSTFCRELLQQKGISVHAYPGEASTCSTLEDWAGLGFGLAILPKSQITIAPDLARALLDGDTEVEIFYEAVWSPNSLLSCEIAQTVSHFSTEATIQSLR